MSSPKNGRSRRARRPAPGAPPGALASAPHRPHKPIRVFHWDEKSCVEKSVAEVEDAVKFLELPGFTWLDLDEAPDADRLGQFRDRMKLHPLAIADVANVPQRPKHEGYDGFDFMVLRMLNPRADGPGAEAEQLSLFFNARWVLTFQEQPGDCLDPVRERLRTGLGNLRARAADYLAYEIIDAVVDSYFPVVEGIGDRLEHLETAVLGPLDRRVLKQLHESRRELLVLRRAVWPLREALAQAARDGQSRFSEQTRLFLRDCYDHTVQLIDLVENFRELSAGLVELYLSSVGFRTNEVMKVLTIISTIFLPLSFIAGVYGMNFDTASPANMPELRWSHGYEFVLVLMSLCAGGMLVYFARKGWLTSPEVLEDLVPREPLPKRR